MSHEFPNAAWFRKLRTNLRKWYRQHGRDLPWRRTRDAYLIWISEIMLQQTTVAAVIPYFERFTDRFPTVFELAAADEQDVLKLWEGLGYYSRARNIHRAARAVVNDHGGEFPRTAAELQKLPGIGRYTAGAIASFAFDEPAPIVEANTLRLYCRLLGFEGDPRNSAGQELLWSFAEKTLPRSEPGELNQALMELGGTLCSVKSPQCEACPLRGVCLASAEGSQDRIPRPKARPKVTQLSHVNLVVRKRDGTVLIRQHSADERWSGLWDFPRYELPREFADAPGAVSVKLADFLTSSLRAETNVEAGIGELLAEINHTVTRYRIRLLCFDAEFHAGRLRRGDATKWVKRQELADVPLTMTARKLAKKLTE